jgi:hypothetical protein
MLPPVSLWLFIFSNKRGCDIQPTPDGQPFQVELLVEEQVIRRNGESIDDAEMDESIFDYVAHHLPGGWEINEGSYGTAVFSAATGTFGVEHTVRVLHEEGIFLAETVLGQTIRTSSGRVWYRCAESASSTRWRIWAAFLPSPTGSAAFGRKHGCNGR